MMHDEAVTDEVRPSVDIKVLLPDDGVIRIESRRLFGEPEAPLCRRFVERAFLAPQIEGVVLAPGAIPAIELRFDATHHSQRQVLEHVAAALDAGDALDGAVAVPNIVKLAPHLGYPEVPPAVTARDRHGVIRYQRCAQRVTGWQIVSERVGAIKLENPVLYRKSVLCEAIERELMSVLGVDRYETSSRNCWAYVEYDPRQLGPAQIIEILDSALASAEYPEQLDNLDLDLVICTASVPLAAVAQFAVPALLPLSAALFAYTAIPSLRGAYNVLFNERRLGVDVLDSIVVAGCLATLQVFPGAILSWCLGFGRYLVRRTEDNSKKLMLGAFGKQPRYCWLVPNGKPGDGVEIEVPLDRLDKGDIVVVHTGEVVPVDGIIVDGLAMIDQHALTGESMPAEKGVGDRVFASTVMVAGKMYVAVEKSGSETATARIAQILNDTAGYKLASQHRGERLADKAVIPTLGLGGLAFATLGPTGAVAVINSDLGTGIRMAAPLAMLSTLALCAQRGVLVKDGRALDLLCEVDTVLFDKTGTLTRERPEIGRMIGINVGIPDGVNGVLRVRVGSRRFMEAEGVPLTQEVEAALDEAHREGHTMVMVAVDDELGGALELRAAIRPEVRGIVRGLRARGIKHIAIISGDHEAPTRKLAEELGMDRYFAQVLPADKADYVEKLQKEGRKVCFVGDGINDAIALKKANVSISLRGATSIATDTAHVVFMEQSLGRLCELRDIARDLHRNVRNSWMMILAPNIACVAGVFTLGFGIGMSVVTNNVASLAALANGLLPMRKVAQLEAERRHLLEMELRQSGFLAADQLQMSRTEFEGSADLVPAKALAILDTHPYRAPLAADD